MRRHYLVWAIAVFGIIGTIYGGYSLIYNASHGDPLPIYGLVLLILGVLALALFLVLFIPKYIASKKKQPTPSPEMKKDEVEETKTPIEKEPIIEKTPLEEPKPEPKKETRKEEPIRTRRPERTYEPSPSYSYSTCYVKLVGYGPVLRVEGNRILDMRNGTYYRIENNVVMQEGYGIRYEIRGNQIKDAFGSYLYEYSGSNINKVYGGFYASVSGNYITIYDLSQKYETTETLSKKQMLVVAALLFGNP